MTREWGGSRTKNVVFAFPSFHGVGVDSRPADV